MNVNRMLFLLPLVCLALSGCPQKRKIREKTAPVTPGGPSTTTKGAASVETSGKKGQPPVTGRKKPAPPPKASKVGATSSKYQCTVAGNCILENGTCCPACLNASAGSMQAMNKVQWKKFQQACKAKKVECKKCRNPGFNVNLVVLCENNKCVVRDFRPTAHATCSGNGDCVLRAAPCCDCIGPPVALSKAGLASYQAGRCSTKKCKACKVAEFQGVSAICVKGRCQMKGQWKKKKIGGGPNAKKKTK